MTSPTELDATAQADLVRRGEASPVELVEAAIARIEAVDPQLDAVVRDRFDAARAEAAGDLPDGPFRGVPLLLKDMGCHVAGEETAYGLAALRDAGTRWRRDSHLAAAFRAAGFVVLGRTTVPELGTTVTTEPACGPPARNPWDPARSPGGSSGGSAAAVAAGMVPVAHASDGGGSIRVPAGACGLVGLKPGRARVGHAPDVGEGWAGATVEGVLTRSVRDTAAVLDAVAGPLPGDPHAAPPLPRPLVEEIGAPVAGLRAGLCASPPDERWLDDPACRAAVAAAGRLLEDLGLAVEEAHPAAFFDDSFSRHFNATIAVDTALVLADLEHVLGRPITDDELEPRNAYYRSSGSRTSAPDYLGSRAWLGSWSRGVAAFWSDQGFDLLVTPTVGAPPPELGWFTAGGPREEGRRIGSYIPWTAQANVTGQPAISLPLHTTDDGLPVGVQLVAAAGREDLLVRVAAALEEAAPWAGRRPALPA